MKYKRFLIPAVLLLALSGCATVPAGRNNMEFTITPDHGLKAGTIVTVTVKTGDEVTAVSGYLKMFADYKLPLKYDSKKKIWYMRQMIPMGYAIPAGEYQIKVEAITKGGDKYYAEKKVSTY
ncbi:MAG: hypothetical protein LLG37_08255 [Spirochaetia bacterium]|nr:hypothetical protein [Spirochaetia bacterium]